MQNYNSQSNKYYVTPQLQDQYSGNSHIYYQQQMNQPRIGQNFNNYNSQQYEQNLQHLQNDDINLFQQQQFRQQQINQFPDKQTVRNKEILVMTIDIGNGQSGKIHVFQNDDPYDLAQKFVEQYDLPETIIEILEENIRQNIDQIKMNNKDQNQEQVNSQQQQNQAGQHQYLDNNGIDELQYNNQVEQENNSQINQQQNLQNEQNKHNLFAKYSSNNKYPQSFVQDLYDNKQNSTKANNSAFRSESLTPPTIRINKDFPDISSSTKRQKYFPEGLVEKIDNQSFEKYMNNNASTDIGNSILNYSSVPAGTSYRNSQRQNALKVNQSFNAEQKYSSKHNLYNNNVYNNNDNSRTEENNKVNKSFDLGKKQNVHERLFFNAKIKNIYQRETERNRSQVNTQAKKVQKSSSQNEINYGVRLYQRGVKQREEKKKQIEKKKQEEIATIQQQYTYHPQINEISSIIAVNLIKQSLRKEPVGEFLQKVAKQQRERKEKAKSFKLNAELDGCSFRPKINQISNQIAQEKMIILNNQSHEDGRSLNQSFIRNRYDLLYEDSKNKIERKIQRDKQYETDQNCTFQPKINTFSKILMNDISFSERMKRYNSKENHNINQVNNQQYNQIATDPNTGQELFKPIIGRPPKKQRTKDNQSVGEYLYEQSRMKQFSKQQQNMQSNDSSVNRSFVCEASSKIIDIKKRQKLIEIFSLLDSDQDGEISSQAIDIQQLDPHILEKFSPLLCEMEELEQSLTLEEFLEASEKLIQPKLNPKSIKLAETRRSHAHQGNSSLYDTFIDDQIVNISINKNKLEIKKQFFIKQKFEEKMQALRQQKEQQELQECTFTPNIQPLYQSQSSYSNIHNKKQLNHQNNHQNKQFNSQPISFQNYIDQKVNNFLSNDQINIQSQNNLNNCIHQPVNYSAFSYQDYQKLFENNNYNSNLFGNNLMLQKQNSFEQKKSNQNIQNYQNQIPEKQQ